MHLLSKESYLHIGTESIHMSLITTSTKSKQSDAISCFYAAASTLHHMTSISTPQALNDRTHSQKDIHVDLYWNGVYRSPIL